MKVTVALAALAAAASATELRGRQDGHNDKPCKKRPDVTSVRDNLLHILNDTGVLTAA